MWTTCSLSVAVIFGQQQSSVTMVDGRSVGERFDVRATFQVACKLKAPSNSSQDVTTSATAQVQFHEELLAKTTTQLQSVRQYAAAEAQVRGAGHEEKSQLAEKHRSMIANASSKKVELVSASGNLTRPELDAIYFPGDHLVVYCLLPEKAVAVGELWSHAADDLAAVLNLDHVGTNEVKSRLVNVENGLAIIQLTGQLRGRAAGVGTSLRVTGEFRYDLRWQRINWVHLRISETRDASPQSPAFSVDAELKMLIQPASTAAGQAIAQSPRDVTDRDRLLRYDSATAGFDLLHSRRWHLIDERARHATWRIVDDEQWIAQCNIIRLKDFAAGKQLSLEEFQADIQQGLGNQFAEFESAVRKQRKDGYDVLRVMAAGIVSEVPVRWIYYHVTSPSGQRINLVFVMDRDKSSKLAADDVTAVSSIVLTAPSTSLPSAPDGESAQDAAVARGRESDRHSPTTSR